MAETRSLTKYCDEKHGTIRVEEWPEGLVLWVGGEIAWRQWVSQRRHVITLKLLAEVLKRAAEELE